MMRGLTIASVMLIVLAIGAPPARAEGFITPFIGYNFGGDSANCPTLTNCSTKRANYGVSVGSMGSLFGGELDFGYANNFFGDVPGADNSVLSIMGNLLVGIAVGPVHPYVLGGFGLIRPHVSIANTDSSDNSLGYDLGGGITVTVAPHVGIRGDIRHLHTTEHVSVPLFSDQRLDFYRASLGLAFKF